MPARFKLLLVEQWLPAALIPVRDHVPEDAPVMIATLWSDIHSTNLLAALTMRVTAAR